MVRKLMLLAGLVVVLYSVSGCCALFNIGCPITPPIVTAETFIFKQKTKVETDVASVAPGKLYDKKGNLTTKGEEIQNAYNNAMVEGTAYVKLVTTNIKAKTADKVDFASQAALYGHAVDALHNLIHPPLADKTVATALIISDVIIGLTKSGIEIYEEAKKLDDAKIAGIAKDLEDGGLLSPWNDYMKKLKVLK